MSLLNIDERIQFTESIGLHHSAFNTNGRFMDSSIKLLSYLRNAVMHNSIIFDCRFNINGKDTAGVKPLVENKLALQNFEFRAIVDYLVLLIFIMIHLGFTKTMLRKFLRDFEVAKEALFQSIPNNIYFEILGSDVNLKLQKTLAFIRDFK